MLNLISAARQLKDRWECGSCVHIDFIPYSINLWMKQIGRITVHRIIANVAHQDRW